MSFKRQDTHKIKSAPESWRRPKGRHSRSRLEKKGAAPRPKAGYRKPSEIRGLHPSGLEEVLVHNVSEVEELEEDQAARISSNVGGRKKAEMVEKADEMDVKVLNRGDL